MGENGAEPMGTEGQPTGDLDVTGQAATSTTGGEPTGVEGLPEDWTPETLKDRWNDYRNLQKEFGKRTESIKEFESKFERFGGVDQLLGWAEYLDTNPKFAKFVEELQTEETVGSLDDYDEETRKAIELVQKMSQAEVQRAINEKVLPLQERLLEQQLQENVDLMEEKYGDMFGELRETMAKLSKTLPEDVQNNPSIEVLEDLYWKAMRVSGKFDDYAAKVYQAKLEKTKKQSMDTPTQKAAPGRLAGKLSMLEAARAAGVDV